MSEHVNTLILAVVLVILSAGEIYSQEKQRPAMLSDFNWLIGAWKRETSRGTLYEKWTQVSDQTIEGESYRINNGAKKFTEFLRLHQFGNEIFYTAKVPHNAFPTPFKLIQSNDQKAVFENPDHDFPQRVIYMRNGAGSFHARIEGKNNGKESAVDFFFTKGQ